MAQYEYGLGLAADEIVYLEEMPVPTYPFMVNPPRGNFVPYSIKNDRGDGHISGHGWPKDTWSFDVLYQNMIDYLRSTYCPGQSANLYISTRNDSGVFAVYYGILAWPSQDQMSKRNFNGTYLGLTFELRRLELQGD